MLVRSAVEVQAIAGETVLDEHVCRELELLRRRAVGHVREANDVLVGMLLAYDLGNFVDELEEVVAVAAVGEKGTVGVLAGEPLLATCTLAKLVIVHRLDAETVAAGLCPGVVLAGLEELAGILGDLLHQPAAGIAHLRRLAFVSPCEPVAAPAFEQLLLPLLFRPESAVIAVQRMVARTNLAAFTAAQAE